MLRTLHGALVRPVCQLSRRLLGHYSDEQSLRQWRATSVPELPEVETLRRLLSRTLVDRRFVDLDVLSPAAIRAIDPAEPRALLDKRVQAVRRRAKFLM